MKNKSNLVGILVGVLASFVIISVVEAQGIKPLSQAADYNGTYQGSPNTGTARYTTLYRDNQDNGTVSGCRGEGCGRHPGVDIAVPSGTEVRTPLAGTIVVSRCDSSWGGLIVIRSAHPSRPWEFIYQSFAHLRSRQYSYGSKVVVGSYVAAGTTIGYSGGSGADSCSGNSTGSHLHYQIDKDDGNTEPYYPAQGSLNYRDDNFAVSAKTYNPMVMIQNGYEWKFDQNGNRELWDLFNLQSWGVSGGALWMDGWYDPYIKRNGLTNCGLSKPCSSSIAAEATDYTQVYLDLYNHCAGYSGKIYFATNREPNFDETKVLYYYPPSIGQFTGVIDASWHYKWSGVITGLRIDPSEQCSYGFDPTYYGHIGLLR